MAKRTTGAHWQNIKDSEACVFLAMEIMVSPASQYVTLGALADKCNRFKGLKDTAQRMLESLNAFDKAMTNLPN